MKKSSLVLIVVLLVFLPIVQWNFPPAIEGTLVNRYTKEPVACVIVWACEVYRDPNGDVFVCDLAWSPSTFSGQDGKFTIDTVVYKEYVLVTTIGEFHDYDILEGENGRPAVWNITRGQKTDTGIIETHLKSAPCGSW